MLKAKMSKKGKCLPLFPSRRSEGKSQTTPVITGLSAVFHMPLPTGTPLAFTPSVKFSMPVATSPRADLLRITP